MRVLFVFVESKLQQEYFHGQFRAHLLLVEPVNKCYNIVNCHNLCFETAKLHIGTCFININYTLANPQFFHYIDIIFLKLLSN